jgi:hypothetical protein
MKFNNVEKAVAETKSIADEALWNGKSAKVLAGMKGQR